MADKPSNSRKKVSYQPARDGQAARWAIEGKSATPERDAADVRKVEAAKARARGEQRGRVPANQKERARARAEQRRQSQRSQPGSKHHDDESTRVRRQRAIVEANDKALGERTAAVVHRSQATGERVRVGSSAPARDGHPARNERVRQREASRGERLVTENPQRARHATSERTKSQVQAAMMPSAAGGRTASGRGAFGLSSGIILLIALLAIVVVFFFWHPWSQGSGAASSTNPGDEIPVSDVLEERLITMPTYGVISPVDFNAVEEEGYTAGFVLAHGGEVTDYSLYDTEPELSDESATVLNDALQPFTENNASVAFLLMDIQTGRGFARNIDTTIYGASSFKGPYTAYLLKKYVDGGSTELTDSFASGYMNGALAYVRSGSDTLNSLIEQTIVSSSNDAFASLRVNFSDSGLAEWLASVDVDESVAYDTWFPFNTVRNLAKLWMETYYFLESESDSAQVLREYMGSTETSFMREALTGVRTLKTDTELVVSADDAGEEQVEAASSDDVEVEELVEASTLKVTGSVGKNLANVMDHSISVIMAPEITVWDKSGWNIDVDEDYDALVDCGIVRCNGRDYLLCAMANVAYTESNVEDFEQLIAAVFNARQDLA